MLKITQWDRTIMSDELNIKVMSGEKLVCNLIIVT